jgi:hypothetical protein
MAKRLPAHEEEILHRVYPTEGSRGVHALLPHRAMATIKAVAHKRGIKTVMGTGSVKVFKEDAILAALIEAGWVKRRAAASLGCSVHTIYGFVYADRDRRLAAAFDAPQMAEAA